MATYIVNEKSKSNNITLNNYLSFSDAEEIILYLRVYLMNNICDTITLYVNNFYNMALIQLIADYQNYIRGKDKSKPGLFIKDKDIRTIYFK